MRGAGGERIGVDHPARPDDNPVAVNEIDLPVGGERAVDDRGLAAEDAIERRAGAGGLDKLRELARADGKGLPVDDHDVARLVDRDRTGALSRNGRRAGRDIAACGISVERDHQTRD